MADVKVTIELIADPSRDDRLETTATLLNGLASDIVPQAAEAAVNQILHGALGSGNEEKTVEMPVVEGSG